MQFLNDMSVLLDDSNIFLEYELKDQCFNSCLELFPSNVIAAFKQEILEYFKTHSIYKILKRGEYIKLPDNEEEKKVYIICEGGALVLDKYNNLLYMFGKNNKYWKYDSNILFSSLSNELEIQDIKIEVFQEITFIEISLDDLKTIINKYLTVS